MELLRKILLFGMFLVGLHWYFIGREAPQPQPEVDHAPELEATVSEADVPETVVFDALERALKGEPTAVPAKRVAVLDAAN